MLDGGPWLCGLIAWVHPLTWSLFLRRVPRIYSTCWRIGNLFNLLVHGNLMNLWCNGPKLFNLLIHWEFYEFVVQWAW